MWDEGNQTDGIVFVLLGFSEYPDLQVPLFLVFLVIYIIAVFTNLGMILIIRMNSKLQTPMYFFLSHLSFIDFCYSSMVTPKMLQIIIVEDKTISFKECMTQFVIGCTCVFTEMIILAVMAYDRMVAVCNPLLYTVVMSPKLCAVLVAGTYLWGAFGSFTLEYFLLQLSYCGPNIINHFCCEYTAILSVSCSDISLSQLIGFVMVTFNQIFSLVIIFASYAFIVVTVFKISSKSGLRKAFSTCASHLTTIFIFHGIILLLYCIFNSKSPFQVLKVATVFYSVVIPMLNPIIYSLRNTEVKEAIRKLFSRNVISYLV